MIARERTRQKFRGRSEKSRACIESRLEPRRSPRAASTSIASDQYGRILASQRFDGINDGVMVATVPAARVPTVYARTGEIVPVLALGFSVWSVVRALTSRTRRSELEHHASGEPVPLA
jgi:hypothetical protein